MAVFAFAMMAGGWLLQAGADRSENMYVRVRVLQEVVDRVESSFVDEVDKTKLYTSAIDGLIRDLGDAHSSFLPADDYENLRIRTQGEYGGVGLEVVDRNDRVTVVSPIPSTPGARAGIRAGDQFFEIDGIPADTMVTDQAVELLRGRAGTAVTIKMMRPGVEEPIEFSVERATIRLLAVPFAVMLEGDIGYVPLQTVRETSSREIRAAVDSLRDEGLRGLVLDLRGNPGGLLDEGVAVSDLFLDKGLSIVETRGRAANQNDTYSAATEDRYPEMLIVVLVDGNSASASEIIAGALQDHDRAVVIGETTYGKGSVQTLFRLTGGDVLRLTTARWFTPAGRSITRDETAEVDPSSAAFSVSGQFVMPTDLTDRPQYKSDAGRTVFGGGGITPDLFVAPETLDATERNAVFRLYRAGGAFTVALFNFSVSYVREHPELESGFELSDSDLEAFFATLPQFGANVERSAFMQGARFVRYQLEREVALQAWGDEGQFLHAQKYDRQLNTALDMLRRVTTTSELIDAVIRAETEQNQNR